MKSEFQFKVHNKYHAELRDARTGELKNEGWAYNVVVNNYYNRLAAGERVGFQVLGVGTGSGTPAVTDTNLFQYLAGSDSPTRSPVQRISNTEASMQYSWTFGESSANGNLTEVGLSDSGSYFSRYFVSHALFTDSENNPITIVKTNVDRLTVTATVYIEVSYDNVYDYCKNWVPYNLYMSKPMADAATPMQPSRYDDWSMVPWLIRIGLGLVNPTDLYTYFMYCHKPGNSRCGRYLFMQNSVVDNTIRYSKGRVLSTEWNKDVTYQIFGIWVTNNSNSGFEIPLPNHNIFAPAELKLERTADGTQTGFDFGIPILMDEVQVYVDGILQPANSYTWNCKDFNFVQAWISAHGTYLVEQPEWEYSSGAGEHTHILGAGTPSGAYFKRTLTNYWVYDFGQPKTVNAFRNTSASYSSSAQAVLEYSNDKENWSVATTIQHTSSNQTLTSEFSPISARYWRTASTNGTTGNANNEDPLTIFSCAFDEMKPQLVLNTAPAANSVVKVKAKSEYPIKNSNWIIDQMLFDYSIVRGGQ